MNITNSKGTIIKDMQSWEKGFREVDNELHWKQGRSAYALAEHFTSPRIEDSEGLRLIRTALEDFGLRNIDFGKAYIEYETMFDNFQNGRVHDLVLWGKSSNNRSVVTCIESRVDESFGSTVKEIYRKGINHVPNSKVLIRIHMLASFLNIDFGTILDLRYQLLTYLVGSIIEGWKADGAYVYMPVIVYKTKLYDEEKGNENKNDYMNFIKKLGFWSHGVSGADMTFRNNICGVDVITSYIEINKR